MEPGRRPTTHLDLKNYLLLQESQLIALLRQKDRAAFKWMVEQWQGLVYNTSLGILQNEEDAEDVAQEVFIKVFESIDDFKEQSKLSTWLYRITVTKSLDAIRRKKRKKRFGFLQSLYGENEKLNIDPPDFFHPGVQAEKKQEAALLFKAIAVLPENQKVAFVLNRLESLSYNEIAEAMKTTPGAVDSLLQRAKKNLRKYLEQNLES